MTLMKNVNGVDQPMNAQEEAATRAGWAAAAGIAPPRRLVAKSVVTKRVNAAGKLAAVIAILDQPANLYARERWRTPDWPNVYFDDPDTVAIISSVGLDPNVILAPGDD